MKKIFFTLIILSVALYSKAGVNFNTNTLQKDSAKVISFKTAEDSIKYTNKVNDLNTKLINLKGELTGVQNQIPADEAQVKDAQGKAHDAQVESKKQASKAVGGDVDDAKRAEKAAKASSDATKVLQDANKQLKRDNKKIKSLNKDIEKTQKKLSKLQSGS